LATGARDGGRLVPVIGQQAFMAARLCGSFSSTMDFQSRWRVEYIPLKYMDASQFKVNLKV